MLCSGNVQLYCRGLGIETQASEPCELLQECLKAGWKLFTFLKAQVLDSLARQGTWDRVQRGGAC